LALGYVECQSYRDILRPRHCQHPRGDATVFAVRETSSEGDPEIADIAVLPRTSKGRSMTDPTAQSPDAEHPQQPVPPQPAPQQPVPPQPAPAAAPLGQAEDVQWASFAHLGGIIGILPSLIIWLVFKDRGQFTNVEAKEALNFQITMLIGYVLGAILSLVLIGALISLAVWVISVVFSIIAFLRVKDGNHYRYPFAIRLIK
jgi:uncharacterized Tic20 family protein